MTTTPTKPLPAIHVGNLEDADVMALIDRYVFERGRRCYGIAEQRLDLTRDREARWICVECGAPEAHRLRWHPRMIPTYSVNDIVAQMAKKSVSVRRVFGLELYTALDERLPTRPSPDAMWSMAAIFASSRAVAIAALRALGIVDDRGLIVGSEARHDA